MGLCYVTTSLHQKQAISGLNESRMVCTENSISFVLGVKVGYFKSGLFEFIICVLNKNEFIFKQEINKKKIYYYESGLADATI